MGIERWYPKPYRRDYSPGPARVNCLALKPQPTRAVPVGSLSVGDAQPARKHQYRHHALHRPGRKRGSLVPGRIVDLLDAAAGEPVTAATMAATIGVSRGVVYNHLRALIKAGRVIQADAGYRLAPRITEI